MVGRLTNRLQTTAVRQCIEIIEQEACFGRVTLAHFSTGTCQALSLMVDPGGENRADGDAKLAEVP